MKQVIVRPAYGRKYKNKELALADWLGNKDFVLVDSTNYNDMQWIGKYCSIRDFSDANVLLAYDGKFAKLQ